MVAFGEINLSSRDLSPAPKKRDDLTGENSTPNVLSKEFQLPNICVQKYGGSSVQSIAHIENVAANIQKTLQNGTQVIVVVSAMGQQTNELCRLAESLNATPPRRELDMLLSSGERVTMSLLSMALDKKGIKAISLTGSQSGILTDGNHGSARIKKIHCARIHAELQRHEVIIIAGFQGVCPETKEVTTLGRGGSDLTAIALSSELQANACDIFTDVPGVMTADPNMIPEAQTIPSIGWESMRHLALNGAGVIHHRAATLAHRKQIPFKVKSSLDLEATCTIVEGYTQKMEEEPLIEGLAHREDQALVNINCPQNNMANHAYVKGLHWLKEQGENPVLYREQISARGQAIEVVMSAKRSPQFYEFIRQNFEAQELAAELQKGLSTVTLVGSGFLEYPSILARFYENLPCEPIIVENHDSAITCILPMEHLKTTLNQLHASFFKER